MNKAFCTECEKYVVINVELKHNIPRIIAGKTYISRDFYICTCAECGAHLTVDEYEKMNLDEIKKQDEELNKMSFWKNDNEYRVNLVDFVERFVAHNTCITLYTTEKTSGGHIWNKMWYGMDWQIAPDYPKSDYYRAHPDVLPCPYAKYNVVAVWGAFEGFHSVDDIAIEIDKEIEK